MLRRLKPTLSRYLGSSVAIMLEVAEAISEGLMMTQFPAAMAPPEDRERQRWLWDIRLTVTT